MKIWDRRGTFSQSDWTSGWVSVASGRPVQSGVAKNSVLRPWLMPKAVRGTGTPTPAASVEPCAYRMGEVLELLNHAIERSDGTDRGTNIVAKDGDQQVGSGADDGDVPGHAF